MGKKIWLNPEERLQEESAAPQHPSDSPVMPVGNEIQQSHHQKGLRCRQQDLQRQRWDLHPSIAKSKCSCLLLVSALHLLLGGDAENMPRPGKVTAGQENNVGG